MKLTPISLAVFASVAAMAVPAFAQQDPTADSKLEKVEVTGSAIKRIDAETAVPVETLKMDDLKKQGITSVEQVMSAISAMQVQGGTSNVIGGNTGGASFANMRALGQNHTLVLLNGRRIANNAVDGTAPDLNMIPFAAIQRIEVLRDGASSLYGTDAIAGVVNFITRKDYKGGTVTVGFDQPQNAGGQARSFNAGYGLGDLATQSWNIYALVDYKKQDTVTGTERPFNQRIPGGLSPTTFPANYYQGGASYNPSAPACTDGVNILPAKSSTACQISTSKFVSLAPQTESASGLVKGTFKVNSDLDLGFEFFKAHNRVESQIAPVPYGGLYMNSNNPYYPTNAALSPTYTETGLPAGVNPGFIHVKWRDTINGPRKDSPTDDQQRFLVTADGTAGAWDYSVGLSTNRNDVQDHISGYSNGVAIANAFINGIANVGYINPFGAQTAAVQTWLQQQGEAGRLTYGIAKIDSLDAHASRELGDWFHTGNEVALAIGGESRRESLLWSADKDFASQVVASTGIDPNLLSKGSRNVQALYAELDVPLTKQLDVSLAARYDKYSDFGSTSNPKVSFQYRPTKQLLLRGSYSTGFRAPSLYDLYAAQTYGNTDQQDDPINCPGGNPLPGKPSAANCAQQFQALNGGNTNLKPETSKNYTLGLVVEPVKDMSIQFDYWQVDLSQTIGSISADTVFGSYQQFAGIFHRNSSGNLSTDGSQCPGANCGYVDLRTQNLGGTKVNGWDIDWTYAQTLADLGHLTYGVHSTIVSNFVYQNFGGDVWHQNVSVFSGSGPVFKYTHNLTLNWNKDQWAAGLAVHYKSGYADQTATNNVGEYMTADAFGTWMPLKSTSLTVGVRNMFDRQPPFSNQTTTFVAGGFDPRFYDVLGRTYYVRGTYNF